MIELVEVIGIAVALSIDAMVVALCWSASQKQITMKHVAKFAVVFGFFQALMPLLGWVAGDALHQFISQWDHWVAFVLLAGVSVSMLKEAFGDDDEEEEKEKCCGHCEGVKKTDIAWGELLVLAVATSLDALAIGFSFSMAGRAIVWPAILIGIICLVLTALAVLAGKRLSEKAKRFETPMTCLGAFVLLMIGVHILYEHGVFV